MFDGVFVVIAAEGLEFFGVDGEKVLPNPPPLGIAFEFVRIWMDQTQALLEVVFVLWNARLSIFLLSVLVHGQALPFR